MSYLLRPGDLQTIRKVGTFTVPADVSEEQVRSLAPNLWVKKWIELNEAAGIKLMTNIIIERDPYPEITDTVRYTYTMTAGFQAVAVERTFECSEYVAKEMQKLNNPRFHIEV